VSTSLGRQMRVQVRTHWIKVYPQFRVPWRGRLDRWRGPDRKRPQGRPCSRRTTAIPCRRVRSETV